MVRMADVMYLSNETEDRKFHNNNILCKHFDYVICDKKKFEPLLVIELDDPKHQYVFRKQLDEFKEKACKEAGLPLLRLQIQDKYDRAKLGEQIHQMIANPVQENE
jgi:very-short-patch-repair endonuclease